MGDGFLIIGYCFPYCFLEIFVGEGQDLNGGGQSRDGGIPPVPPLGKTLWPGLNFEI